MVARRSEDSEQNERSLLGIANLGLRQRRREVRFSHGVRLGEAVRVNSKFIGNYAQVINEFILLFSIGALQFFKCNELSTGGPLRTSLRWNAYNEQLYLSHC